MFERLVREGDDDTVRRHLLSLMFTLWAASAGVSVLGSVVLGVALPPVPEGDLPLAYIDIASEPRRTRLPALPAVPEPPRAARAPAPVPPPSEPEPSAHPEVERDPPMSGSIACCPSGCCGDDGCAIVDAPWDRPRPPQVDEGMVLRRRLSPAYPRAARSMRLGAQRCLVDVLVDARGEPTEVSVTGCPAVFHPGTRSAILQWRWYPRRGRDGASPWRTQLSVVYRMDG
jgi:hypothetical protein